MKQAKSFLYYSGYSIISSEKEGRRAQTEIANDKRRCRQKSMKKRQEPRIKNNPPPRGEFPSPLMPPLPPSALFHQAAGGGCRGRLRGLREADGGRDREENKLRRGGDSSGDMRPTWCAAG